MPSTPLKAAFAGVLALSCAPDVVEPNRFTADARHTEIDAGTGGSTSPDAKPDTAGAGDGRPTGIDVRGGTPADPGCDLNGRWLVAQRVLAVAIGQRQAAHSWFYYEIAQTGADVVVTRGLHCGFEVIKKTDLAASVDSSATWPALLTHNSSNGRRGQFVREGAGCHLSLEREYLVRGASLPHYGDPAVPLPGRSEAAAEGKPGWEDWDGDGNPGISLKVTSPLANGTLFVCQRDYTIYDGATAADADKLQVAVTYSNEQVALGRSAGSAQAIESGSSPSSDQSQHFAVLHRLAPGQAEGSDEEICAAIRTLRTSLTPEADQ